MSLINAQLIGPTSPADYHGAPHAERGTPEFVMTSSALREFLECPSRWKAGYSFKGSKSTCWGDLLDAMLLTPDRFNADYHLIPETYAKEVLRCPKCESVTAAKKCNKCKCDREPATIDLPWSPQSDTCKQWLTDHPNAFSQGEHEQLIAAAKRVMADERLGPFLAASESQIQVSATWRDEATGLETPCKALLDAVPELSSEFGTSLGDLKSCRSANPRAFQRQIFQHGYHIQAAFHSELYTEATGENRPNFCFLLSENFHPWEPGRVLLGSNFLEAGQRVVRAGMGIYAQCVAFDIWPNWNDRDPDSVQGWSVAEPEPWMEYESLSMVMQAQTQAAEAQRSRSPSRRQCGSEHKGMQ